MIRYLCPKCRQLLTAKDAEAGAKLSCTQCGQRLQVPTPPPNKTMLGQLDEPANKTILGKLEGERPETVPSSPRQITEPPPVRRTLLVDPIPPLAEAAPEPSAETDIPEVEPVRPRRRRRYEEDDEDDRPRRRPRTRSACPRCGCTDYPRQTTKFGVPSIILLVVGVIFWPLLIVAFFLLEKWDVCQECGEKLRQTGTGFFS